MSLLENNWHLVEEMTERLKELKPYKVILFGSYANGNPTKDSDLDVLVILDSDDFVKSFKEKIERKMPVSKILLEINYQIAMDILVYSRAEFECLKEKDNFFIKEIETSGKVLYCSQIDRRGSFSLPTVY
jgi:predicted nucleotidyltransferase